MSPSEDKLDAALDALNNWYDDALKAGMGFKDDKERQEYLNSLGDPEKHPMFATNTEDLVGNPLAEALWAIKEEGKTRLELAEMYKEEGNEWIKKVSTDKNANKEAYDRYTHALTFMKQATEARQQGTEDERDASRTDSHILYSQIYSNRALTSLYIHNYGSCKKDCDASIALWAGNMKAHSRKCKALLALHQYNTCIQACQQALLIDNTHQEILTILHKAQSEVEKNEQQLSKSFASTWQQLKIKFTETWNICQDLQIGLGYPSSIQPEPLQLRQAWPSIQSEQQTYTWPVLFLYPQYNHFDIIPDVDIANLVVDYLTTMFPEKGEYEQAIPWDSQEEYQASKLVMYLQLDQAAEVKTLSEWFISNLEHYLLVGNGQLELMKYALQQLSKEYNPLPLGYQSFLNSLDDLNREEIHRVVENREKIYQEKVKQIIDKNATAQRPVCKYMEIHLGCNFYQIMTAMKKRNMMSRGILSVLVFPRGNAAHQKFLKTIANEHLSIEMLNPQE